MKDNARRLKKTKLNVVSNLFIMMMRIVMLFVVRIVFIRALGKLYLGVDSLFTNLLSVLSIGDLGITSAVNFVLYKPLSENDTEKVSSIMTYYKKLYRYMGMILCLVGIILMFFLPLIVKEDVPYLYLIYCMYLFNTVSTYFVSYKESLIVADQNRYKLTIINFSFYMLLYLLRIAAILLTKNFIIYVLLLDIVTLLQRIAINMYVSKVYTEVDFNSENDLKEEEKLNIWNRIKAMFIHKIGSFVINGTDSVVISATKGLGVVTVGLYTNYLSIVTIATSLYEQVYKGITSSFGDLAAQENENAQERVFNIVSFIGFLLYGLTSVGFYFLLSPIIGLFFGNQFIIDKIVVITMIINFYFSGIIASIDMIKEATGEFVVDKYVPLIQSIINLGVSVVLAHFIGLLGVVVGTTVSYVTVSLWNRPYIAYKYIFKSSKKHFILQNIKYLFVICLSIVCIKFITNPIDVDNALLSILVTGIICVLVFLFFVIGVFYKSDELGFVRKEMVKLIKK